MIKILERKLSGVVIDTSSLIADDKILDKLIDMYQVYLSIVTVEELDNLKTNKDSDLAFKARRAIRKISEYESAIHFDLNRFIDENLYFGENKFNTNDDIIVSCAKRNDAYIMSEDLNLKIKSKALNVPILELYDEESEYTGFKEFTFNDEEFADFYVNLDNNKYDLFINEYITIKDLTGDIKDVRRWNGEKYCEIYNKKISTKFFGKGVKPKDCYQAMVIDSIMKLPVTAISGKAGTGKSFLALVCAIKLIEDGKYDRITVLFNPTKTRGASDMGFYSGDATEKALQNSIGQMLSSKFVDDTGLLQQIGNGTIRLVSMADIRGMEVGEREILYITEAQNTDADLMRLCLSRAAEGCKVIIEGDFNSQVDNLCFEDEKNGMRRAVDKLKNEDIFGYIELQNIYRNKLAKLVDTL